MRLSDHCRLFTSVIYRRKHPVHLHGHNFSVVRSAGSSSYNFDTPVIRDVVNIGTAGDHVTIRFFTDNLGPWFFHCHNDFHLDASVGPLLGHLLMLTINVSGEKAVLLSSSQKMFPTCRVRSFRLVSLSIEACLRDSILNIKYSLADEWRNLCPIYEDFVYATGYTPIPNNALR